MFANVIIPHRFFDVLTYHVPASLRHSTEPGHSVKVPLGLKKFTTGIVLSTQCEIPSELIGKRVAELLESTPLLPPVQLRFIKWVSAYYLCPLGSVLKAALPIQLRTEGPLLFVASHHTPVSSSLQTLESKVQQALSTHNALTYDELQETTSSKQIGTALKNMLQRGWIDVRLPALPQKTLQLPKPNLQLSAQYVRSGNVDSTLLASLEKYRQQRAVLAHYLECVAAQSENDPGRGIVAWKTLSAISGPALKRLVQKGVFQEVSGIPAHPASSTPAANTYSIAARQTALEIELQFKTKPVVLLHSAQIEHKRTVCFLLIEKALRLQQQVLYLVPDKESALHTTHKATQHFGSTRVLHMSSPARRFAIWQALSRPEPMGCLVVTTRSGVFLPWRSIGLVLVENEHQACYKQTEQLPYYHARDAAIMLAQHYRVPVLLTSPTPSIDTYYKTRTGRYGLVHVPATHFRTGERAAVSLVHMGAAHKRGHVSSGLSRSVLQALERVLGCGQQALIFQSRRGYAPYVMCKACAWVPRCVRCAVGLAYHSVNAQLCCHYCGYRTEPSKTCRACCSGQLKNMGCGTEQVEEALHWYFPSHSIASLDADCSPSLRAQLLERFAAKQIDVLVGTQLLAQARFYGKVALVCVLETDRLLRLPNFRTGEQCFQLLTQLLHQVDPSQQGAKAVIQTYSPPQAALQEVVQGRYDRMYCREITERMAFGYPPYTRLIRVVVMHPQSSTTGAAARRLQTMLKVDVDVQVLGPHDPSVAQVRGLFHAEIWLKIPKSRGTTLLRAAKDVLLQSVKVLQRQSKFRHARVLLDVDPL